MTKNFSVIIPAYNSAATIKACIESVLPQLDDSDELLVVDDGSRDGTIREISGFTGVKLLRHEHNRGAAVARNTGVDSSVGKILLFLDSDVMLKSGNLQKVRKFFHERSDIAAFSATLDAEKSSHNFFTDYKNLYMNYIFGRCSHDINFLYGSFCGIRRDCYLPWPANPKLGEDSHLGYLLSKSGQRIFLMKSVKVIHLKIYTLRSLARNDFLIAENFTFLFLSYKRWKTLFGEEKFGHTTKHQKLSLLLACLTFSFSLKINPVSILLFLLWLMLNTDFFLHLSKKRGFFFGLSAVAWTFFDHLVYSTGILTGCFLFIWRMR